MYSHVQTDDRDRFSRFIEAGIVIEWDADNFCTVEALERDGKSEAFRVFPLHGVARPVCNPITQDVRELDPVQIDGLWTQQWSVHGLDAATVQANMAAIKGAKREEINAARLAANFSTFTHAGKVIACDQLSRSDIDGTNGFIALYGVLPPGWPGGWKAVDNTYTPIATVADWKAFYASMFAAGAANFAKAQQLKAALDVATTADEIAAIAW